VRDFDAAMKLAANIVDDWCLIKQKSDARSDKKTTLS
jgi:hypothetical protein